MRSTEPLYQTLAQRERYGLPAAQDVEAVAARRNSSLIVYACILERRNIEVCVSLGVTDAMIQPPFVWRWLVDSQRGKQDIADLEELYALMAGMEQVDRGAVLRQVTECEHPIVGAVAATDLLPQVCRHLVKLHTRSQLMAATGAFSAAVQMQFDDEIAKAKAALTAAQEAYDRACAPVALTTWADEVTAVVDATEGEAEVMVPTGLHELDEHIGGGLGAGWLTVIMAPPKQGKTALAVNTIAAHTLQRGGRVALVSLEMPKSQVIQRLLARESGVPVRAMNARDLTPYQRSALATAADTVARWDLEVLTDTSSLHAIAAKLTALHRTKPLTLAVVDYLQLVSAGQKDRREDIETITRGLKLLAMDLGVPLLLLSQPNNSDAKEGTVGFYSGKGSGSISADCDLMLIPRRDKDDPSKAGIEIAGGRHAEPRKWDVGSLAFDGARMLFREVVARAPMRASAGWEMSA